MEMLCIYFWNFHHHILHFWLNKLFSFIQKCQTENGIIRSMLVYKLCKSHESWHITVPVIRTNFRFHSFNVLPAKPATSAPKLKPIIWTRCILTPFSYRNLIKRAKYRPTRGTFCTEFQYLYVYIPVFRSNGVDKQRAKAKAIPINTLVWTDCLFPMENKRKKNTHHTEKKNWKKDRIIKITMVKQ